MPKTCQWECAECAVDICPDELAGARLWYGVPIDPWDSLLCSAECVEHWRLGQELGGQTVVTSAGGALLARKWADFLECAHWAFPVYGHRLA